MVKNLKREMATEVVENFIESIKSFGFDDEEIIKVIKEKLERSK